jgi:hypothetical protein
MEAAKGQNLAVEPHGRIYLLFIQCAVFDIETIEDQSGLAVDICNDLF